MGILLEDVEIVDAVLLVSATGLNNLPATEQGKSIARAQLKKVVEFIDKNFYIGVGCDGLIEYEGDYQRWQALKKEAGID